MAKKPTTIISDERDEADVDKLFADLTKGKKAAEDEKLKEGKERAINEAVVAGQTKERLDIEAERQLGDLADKKAPAVKSPTDKGDFDEKMAHDKAEFADGEALIDAALAAAEKAQKTGKPEDQAEADRLSKLVDESNHPTEQSIPGPSGSLTRDMTANTEGYSPAVDITPAVRQQAAAANIQDAKREGKQAEAELREDPERAALEANAGEPEIDWKDPTIHVDLPTDHAMGPNADQPPDMNAEAMPDPTPGHKDPDHNYGGLRHTRAYLDDEDAEANMSEQTRAEISAGKAAGKAEAERLSRVAEDDEAELRRLGVKPVKNTIVPRDRAAVPRPK